MINEERAVASISQELSADHARLDQLFDDACSYVGAADFTRATPAFHEFARGLGHHIAVEARFLFPAFAARAGMPGPTTVMRHEHRAIEQLLALAAASLEDRDASRFGAEAAELAAILAGHNRKEERILYPRSDAVLDEAERVHVLAALRI